MTNLGMLTKKALAAATLTVAGVSAFAAPFPDFTVFEGSVPGNLPIIFVADKINGSYAERITFTDTSFTASAFGDLNAFLSDDGLTLVTTSQLNNKPLGVDLGYGMYALFSATGTVSPGPITTFIGISASFSLFIDPSQDTTKSLGATGSDPVILAGSAEDYLIASASSLASGVGVLVAGVGGFFDLVFTDFTLTVPGGTTFFVSPSPFYLRVNVDGDFDDFEVIGTQTVTGDFSAVFQVPEPGSLALLGLGLLGLALGLRRRRIL